MDNKTMNRMNCIVTGAAGFVGSHLCRRLLREGHKVVGVDSIKRANIDDLLSEKKFRFILKDLCDIDYAPLMEKAGIIFHLAAEASVRASWGKGFSLYLKNNIEVTQKLLEAVKEAKIKKLIYASSFAIYDTLSVRTISESSPLLPYSPYAMSKLAAEHLCFLYHRNYGVPVVSLRFFSIYGPGERPDTAFHKFMKAIAMGESIRLYGDGEQSRDVTYIDDAINAYLLAAKRGKEGEAYNIGTGRETRLNDIFPILGGICGKKIRIKRMPKQKGDVLNVFANIEKAKECLGYSPKIDLSEGLKREWAWIQDVYGVAE